MNSSDIKAVRVKSYGVCVLWDRVQDERQRTLITHNQTQSLSNRAGLSTYSPREGPLPETGLSLLLAEVPIRPQGIGVDDLARGVVDFLFGVVDLLRPGA